MNPFYKFTEIRDNQPSTILINKNATDQNNQLPRISPPATILRGVRDRKKNHTQNKLVSGKSGSN